MFRDGTQLLIDLKEQGSNKLHGGHTALLSKEGWQVYQRGRIVERLQAQKRVLLFIKFYMYYMVCNILTPLVISHHGGARLALPITREEHDVASRKIHYLREIRGGYGT